MTNTDAAASADRDFLFRLYVAGGEQNSRLARENLMHICEQRLKGRYRVEEVDVVADFASALADGVFVTPTLILLAPGPRAVVVGNLADSQKVLAALRLGSGHGG